MATADMLVNAEKDWEAEAALQTLVEADRIRNDPKMVGRIQQAASKLAEAADRVAQQYGNEGPRTERHPDRDRKDRTEF